MAKCPYADRECTPDCKAFDNKVTNNCFIMHMQDRTNKLLNFIEKKLDRK
jgi:hypothetical protein